jgi:hypothetical protein
MAKACGSQAGSKTGMYTVHNDRRLFTMFNMSGTKKSLQFDFARGFDDLVVWQAAVDSGLAGILRWL